MLANSGGGRGGEGVGMWSADGSTLIECARVCVVFFSLSKNGAHIIPYHYPFFLSFPLWGYSPPTCPEGKDVKAHKKPSKQQTVLSLKTNPQPKKTFLLLLLLRRIIITIHSPLSFLPPHPSLNLSLHNQCARRKHSHRYTHTSERHEHQVHSHRYTHTYRSLTHSRVDPPAR